MHIQYSPRRFYPNLPDSCRARDLSTLRVFLFYLHSNRNFSTRTRGNTLRETKEGKGFVYSPGIREFGSIRRIERVFRVSRIVGVGCVFLRGVSIRNVARGEAQCEWGLGEGIVHSTLLLLWHNLLSPLLLARATKSNPRRDGERGNESDDVKCYASK